MSVQTTPVEASLFASLDPPRLAGSRCTECGTAVFPVAPSCPKRSADAVETVALPEPGTVWTWTIPGFQPKPPYMPPADRPFEPFPVGYIDLGDVLVESRLIGDRESIAIGTPMRLTTLPVWQEGDSTVVTYAFEPDGERA